MVVGSAWCLFRSVRLVADNTAGRRRTRPALVDRHVRHHHGRVAHRLRARGAWRRSHDGHATTSSRVSYFTGGVDTATGAMLVVKLFVVWLAFAAASCFGLITPTHIYTPRPISTTAPI